MVTSHFSSCLRNPIVQSQATLGMLVSSSGVPHRSSACATRRVAGGDVERHDLEQRALRLPSKNGGQVAVGVDAPHPVLGRRHVEHHDVVGMVGKDAVQIAGGARPRPIVR